MAVKSPWVDSVGLMSASASSPFAEYTVLLQTSVFSSALRKTVRRALWLVVKIERGHIHKVLDIVLITEKSSKAIAAVIDAHDDSDGC